MKIIRTNYKEIINSYLYSTMLHVSLLILFNSIHIQSNSKNWKFILETEPKKNDQIIMIPKIIENAQKPSEIKVKPNIIKKEKKIIEKKIINKIATKTQEKNIDLSKEPEVENFEKKSGNNNISDEPVTEIKHIDENTSFENTEINTKIVLNESRVQGKSKFNINFNENEVVMGRKTWIGAGIGTAPISHTGSYKSIKSNKYGLSSSANSQEKVDTTAVSSAQFIGNQEKIYESYELDNVPNALESVNPAYPELAQRLGIEGKIVLKLLIDKDGLVKDVEVISEKSKVGFEESAITAVKQYKFSNPTVHGNPVSTWAILPIEFELK